VQLLDSKIENTVDSVETITCPYCDYETTMSLGKLPAKPVATTCPKCSCRFLFKPRNSSVENGLGASRSKYRNDYDIIRKDVTGFYAEALGRQKKNASLILVIFTSYGLMYFIVTSIHYFFMPLAYRKSANISEYLMVLAVYVLLSPVIVMHSWKFIDTKSLHITDRLYSYKSVFFVTCISYVALLIVTSYFFSGLEMPLALIMPVIGSSLVPSFLHVFTD